MLKELMQEYELFFEENMETLLGFLSLYIKSGFKFDDAEFLIKILNPVKKYFKSSLNELKVYNYILFNSWRYDEDDLFSAMDMLFQIQHDKDVYIEGIFDRLSYSIDMDDKEKFYISGKEPEYVDKDMINEFKLAMLGYSRHNVYDFLIDEEMLTVENVWYFNDLIHEFKLNNENSYKSGVRLVNKIYGQEIKEISVPKTLDDYSMLINVHELAHVGVFNVSNKLAGYDILNNDIPKFYEGVFKMKDDLIKRDIKHTLLSKKLLDEYKDEPFLEQIEKYKYYVKKI